MPYCEYGQKDKMKNPKELRPVKKWHSNRCYIGNNGVEPLPVTILDAQGQVTLNSIWRLNSVWERIKFVWNGELTLRVAGSTQPPVAIIAGDAFGKEEDHAKSTSC